MEIGASARAFSCNMAGVSFLSTLPPLLPHSLSPSVPKLTNGGICCHRRAGRRPVLTCFTSTVIMCLPSKLTHKPHINHIHIHSKKKPNPPFRHRIPNLITPKASDDDEPEEINEAPPPSSSPEVFGDDSIPGDEAVQVAKEGGSSSTLRLASVFGLWYLQNVVFNIYNKKVLNIFPYPWLLASFQLLVGSLWMSFLWASKLQPFPPASPRFLAALAGPALFHAVGHISACVSFSHAAVSFTHVIKSAEPAFSVAFSALLGTFYPLRVWLSIVPIVAGCSLAAVTEVSFSAAGLWGALISNVGFVLRNIYSKQSLREFSHVDGLNLYGWISILALAYLFPVAVAVEGGRWAEGFRAAVAAAPSAGELYGWVALSGVFYHLYNQSSYQALDRISPLTFSVGNTMKRVVVIVASVLVFRNPVRPLNALGSAIAVLGTFLYSQATALVGKGGEQHQEAEGAES